MPFADLSSDIRASAPDLRGRLLANQELSGLTWFRVGGPAQILFTPADDDDLAYLLSKLPEEIPVTVIGLGSKELDFSTFEASCRTLRAERRRDVYEIAGECHGEGRPMRVVFTVRVDGDTLSFISQRGFDFSPKRFRRCR